ncbi:hypothetical protein F4556_000587 [Kitasatospora gansuensis]|uniref:Uncharacterized protein n=1 Tax=Kitasatospora gansuensis TaxID=258050 RepID=A0A7W7S7N5_9ACTN|nr:hypothetical protein [Kitasatospora gansuensis]MBB4945052.1 hypothetical protein [Kitasatospora gansuensis]
MFRHSERLRRLADRDGVTVHTADRTGPPDEWTVRLTAPTGRTTAAWAFRAPGDEPPRVGDVLEQWLSIATRHHPMLAVPEPVRSALAADLGALLGDRLPEYLAGLGRAERSS